MARERKTIYVRWGLPVLRCAALCAAAAAASATPGVARQPGAAVLRTIDIAGHAMRAQVSGLENRSPGQPVIVFEAGATHGLDAWARVVPLLIGTTPLVAYDRAGLGESAWDDVTPTPRHVSARLRRLLHELGAAPPYILVGHSWGGSLMRYFAGYHPDEVAGIVYVDPGPVVTQSPADELVPFQEIGAGSAEYEAFWSAYAALMQGAAPAIRSEFDVFRGLMRRDVGERDLPPAPAVPVVMILAAKPYPPLPGLPFDAARHFEADLRHRIRTLQEWALASERATVVVTNHTSHAVPQEDPDLVVWAIRRVLSAMRQ